MHFSLCVYPLALSLPFLLWSSPLGFFFFFFVGGPLYILDIGTRWGLCAFLSILGLFTACVVYLLMD